MDFEVIRMKMPRRLVMYTERSLPYHRLNEIGNDYKAISDYITRSNVQIKGSFVRYSDDRENKVKNLEICFAVEKLLPEVNYIKAMTIQSSEFKFFRGLHRGSYEGLWKFNEEMETWFNNQNLIRSPGLIWEIYHNSLADVSEADLLTEILWPIE